MGLVRTKVAKICEMLLQKTLFSHLFSSLQLEYRWIVALRFWKYPYTPSFLFSTVTSVTSISVNLQVFVNQWNGSVRWVAIPPISITLLSHCCHTIITLLSHCLTLLSHYFTLLSRCCHTTSHHLTLLSYCCHLAVTLLSYCCHWSRSFSKNQFPTQTIGSFHLKKATFSPQCPLFSRKCPLFSQKCPLFPPKCPLFFWKKWHIIKEGSHFIAQLCDRCDSKKHKTPGIYARAYANGEEDVHRLSCANCACTFAVKREEDGENVAFFL